MPAVLALVALSAFGLGRLSVVGVPSIATPEPKIQTAAAANTPAKTAQISTLEATQTGDSDGQYVASKTGSKYYRASCGAVSRIKEENKVWFDSAAEAEAAGYTKAANCPGL